MDYGYRLCSLCDSPTTSGRSSRGGTVGPSYRPLGPITRPLGPGGGWMILFRLFKSILFFVN